MRKTIQPNLIVIEEDRYQPTHKGPILGRTVSEFLVDVVRMAWYSLAAYGLLHLVGML